MIEAVPATAQQASDSGYSKRRLWVRGAMWRPNEAEMRDVQVGSRTVVTVEARRLDQGLAESFFTEAELVRGRP